MFGPPTPLDSVAKGWGCRIPPYTLSKGNSDGWLAPHRATFATLMAGNGKYQDRFSARAREQSSRHRYRPSALVFGLPATLFAWLLIAGRDSPPRSLVARSLACTCPGQLVGKQRNKRLLRLARASEKKENLDMDELVAHLVGFRESVRRVIEEFILAQFDEERLRCFNIAVNTSVLQQVSISTVCVATFGQPEGNVHGSLKDFLGACIIMLIRAFRPTSVVHELCKERICSLFTGVEDCVRFKEFSSLPPTSVGKLLIFGDQLQSKMEDQTRGLREGMPPRDRQLSASLLSAVFLGHTRVLAVVGANHVAGISSELERHNATRAYDVEASLRSCILSGGDADGPRAITAEDIYSKILGWLFGGPEDPTDRITTWTSELNCLAKESTYFNEAGIRKVDEMGAKLENIKISPRKLEKIYDKREGKKYMTASEDELLSFLLDMTERQKVWNILKASKCALDGAPLDDVRKWLAATLPRSSSVARRGSSQPKKTRRS